MRNRLMELRDRTIITLRIDQIRSIRANFYRINGPFFCIKRARA
nr:MAG TPA: hypothetical protein [Caudoviricetes sp.]